MPANDERDGGGGRGASSYSRNFAAVTPLYQGYPLEPAPKAISSVIHKKKSPVAIHNGLP